VWTPKRLLLLVLGLIVFISAYAVYAYFLGGIDGLAALPEDLWPPTGPVQEIEPIPARENEADRRLRLAFGEAQPELDRTIKLEVRAHGLVLAADQLTIESDGRVKLNPFSLAIFAKDGGDGKFPEINTIQSHIAYLTFDQPISNPTDMGNRKIIGGELIGDVTLIHNRRTPEKNDDLSLRTPGPVYYNESQHRIWTDKVVMLEDTQSKPRPTKVNAEGMDLHLTPDAVAVARGSRPAQAARKPRPEGMPPVSRVVLKSNVHMYLWVDARSGFLGPAGAAAAKEPVPGAADESDPPPATPAAGPEKIQLVIHTLGPFTYDVAKEHARFDIAQQPGPHPDHVTVSRVQELGQGNQFDQLVCDHLELQFRRKNPGSRRPGTGPGPAHRAVGLEIEQAHAWGASVTLVSDLENLEATGNDLVYTAPTPASGAQTLLKGDPMVAAKDGNKIHARELRLLGADPKGGVQRATALGPGRIDLLDRTTGKWPRRARWQQELISTKEGAYDLLTLKGAAGFEDDEHGQHLQADTLKVWLEPAAAPSAASAARAPAEGEAQRRRPHHLEATGHVTARSPDLRVHDSERLVIWFRNTPPLGELPVALPRPAEVGSPAAPGTRHLAAKPAGPGAPPGPAAPPRSLAGRAEAVPGKAKRPLDLSARAIEAYVLRAGQKNELEKIWCEGTVRVRQEPAVPEDRGVDIRGDTLELTRFAEGNVLVVTGEPTQPAQVQLNKLTILGPEVTIDQKENTATVNGVGSMRLPSTSNFEGGKLAQPVELTVHWNKDMFFNGQHAVFSGGIQAEQDSARLACESMQVFLDHPVSFKEGEKGSQAAKVKTLVCDRKVRFEDSKRQGPTLHAYSFNECRVLSLDNETGVVTSSGPGEVRLLQRGGVELGAPGAPAGARPPSPGPRPAGPGGTGPTPAGSELKLTRVRYTGRMVANNKERTALFLDNVEVVHLPTDNPHVAIDLDHRQLPPGWMYLRCEKLLVRKVVDGGQTGQQMDAFTKVVVEAQDMVGRAEVVKYDELKDLVIFEGGPNSLATLARVVRPGGSPEHVRGKKIFYWRRDGQVKIDGGLGISGGSGP
jgi:lipopolysaccharide export system protein LptA